jgi:hypothetical protein
MNKFEYVFNSIPYSEENIKPIENVLKEIGHYEFTFQPYSTGCILLIIYLDSFMDFLALESEFMDAGLRGK